MFLFLHQDLGIAINPYPSNIVIKNIPLNNLKKIYVIYQLILKNYLK